MENQRSFVGGVGIAAFCEAASSDRSAACFSEASFSSASCAACLSTTSFSAKVFLSSSSEASSATSFGLPTASGASATPTDFTLSTPTLSTPWEAVGCRSIELIPQASRTPKTTRANDTSSTKPAHRRRLLNLRRSDLLPMYPLRSSHLRKSRPYSAAASSQHARDSISTFRKAVEEKL